MLMSLRVCMVIYHYWPGPEGGTERQCRKLASALHRRGVLCTVLTSRPHRGVTTCALDDGVRIVRLPTM
ncbi:MAG: glycosyltransferase family 1 protein, partial [Kiritimatiellaeota bacterium]|nr:glycosyltransferase family 1 protein [Kiritimatiellota bacterium]